MLFDANVLVYAINTAAPQHPDSRRALDAAIAGDLIGLLVPQVLLEFFAIVANPRRTQRPLPPVQAWAEVEALRAALPVLDVRPSALEILGELVAARQPVGQEIYDLFLIAQLRSHGVTAICTYNTADFAGIAGLRAVTPAQL